MWRVFLLSALAACPAASRTTPHQHGPLVTTGETTHWRETGHYDEAVRLCHDFAAAYDHVACDEIGRTSEDRPIVALTITRAPGAPFIYIQGGIHAGEIEGKDAGFWFVRDLLDGKVAPGALAAVNLVFVPVINPDGHGRFAPNNRPNQRGPVAMGQRANGQRFNINRDFMKADTPEIAAVLGVFRARDPLVIVDLHTTDGAKFEHDIAIDMAPIAPRSDHLEVDTQAISAQLVARMTALGHLPIDGYYPSFVKDDDPASGFALGEAPPRFSHGYASQRGKIGILVETHSWKTYEQRALSTYHLLQSLFELAAHDAPTWLAAVQRAQAVTQKLGGTDVAVIYDNSPHQTMLDFRGYAYERRPSEISGGTWVVYDETTPQVWHIPLRDEIVPKLTVHVPKAGYIIEGGFAAIATPIFDRHGIAYRKLTAQPRLGVEVFRATKATLNPPYEGHARAGLEGEWTHETRTLDRGAVFVPIDQPLARLVIHLCEPQAPDSLTAWGLFDAAFGRTEYLEPYMAEEAARTMIAADPTLRAKFDAAVAADPELAKSPDKRLDWFYQRMPAWDERVNLVPVYRADTAPQ